jgi:hypothetical protein
MQLNYTKNIINKLKIWQILVYAFEYTDKQKHIHLFGVNAMNKTLATITHI